MKLYIIKNARNEIHNTAFVDKKIAIEWKYHFEYKSGMNHLVEEIDLPFIGRSVCYVYADYGIKSDLNNHIMEENTYYSHIYACMQHAKNDQLWLNAIDHMINNPHNKYHVTDNMIATDLNGNPFEWGNYDGFNVTIKRIRVNKERF